METNNGEFSDRLDLMNKRAASDMLEDALQHFDNFIDGTANMNGVEQLSDDEDLTDNNPESGLQGVALLMEDLRNAVEATLDAEVEDKNERKAFAEALLKHISRDTLAFYRKLLKIQNTNENESDKIVRLQAENDSLSLQASVLTDQIELQTEKLEEIETQLNEAVRRLEGADARLQEEVAAKTRLETQKLELLNEMSNYKINLAQREQQRKLEKVGLAEAEKRRLDVEARSDQYKQLAENLKKNFHEKEKEIERLKLEIESLKSAPAVKLTTPDEGIVHDHEEKDRRLLQLRMPDPCATSTPLSNDQNFPSVQHSKKVDTPDDATGSHLPTTPTSYFSPNIRAQSLEKLHTVRAAKTDQHLSQDDDGRAKHPSGSSGILSDATTSPLKGTSSWHASNSSKSSSTPNLALTETGLPPQHLAPSKAGPHNVSPHPDHFHQRKKHGFRKFFTSFRLRRSRSTSLEPGAMTAEGIASEKDENFQRGGLRSTAGPRLGWNPRDQVQPVRPNHNDNVPFQRWDADQVCQWLTDIGLVAYVESARSWIQNGDTLLRATNHELEKELGVRHALHKKKLMLHLQSLAGGGSDDEEIAGAASMNDVWVARWLDDIGLPQYKDAFHESCIDGRTLHHLTVSDAQKLKVCNLFHLISIRRGIEMLRRCQFDPTQLKRRPVHKGDTEDVSLWTNHRVMEWLRSADLAEYAPNLRGSGVHGAIMVLEPLFTSETLAALLHIPHSKSLLRRHLAAKLEEVLPAESVHQKKERAKEPGYQPLNVTIKYKVGRRSFGGFGRLRSSSAAVAYREFGSVEYVCPMSSSAMSKTMAGHRTDLEKRMQIVDMKEKRGADDEGSSADNVEVIELDESATREINAFSKEINTLTSNWATD
ncbi:liprin-beta-1-like isoform X2 [Clavelina lepadiformis]|uniref:liprin-beta-1-like isoform X2 n=1 Tax=Clavelina lepadiformis TaxID=159417 RepID=UPI0040428971